MTREQDSTFGCLLRRRSQGRAVILLELATVVLCGCANIQAPAPSLESGVLVATGKHSATAWKTARKDLNLQAHVPFDFRDEELKVGARTEIDTRLIAQLGDLHELDVVMVTGHTDKFEGGTRQGSKRLSERRANAVREYLVAMGVPRDKIEVLGMGRSQPPPGMQCEEPFDEGGGLLKANSIACQQPLRMVDVAVRGKAKEIDPLGVDFYPLWYATNREPIDRKDESKGYSDGRDDGVHYGHLVVEVSKDYLRELRSPSWITRIKRWFEPFIDTSPEGSLKVRDPLPLSNEQFFEQLRKELQGDKPDERVALVYLHGFRTTFIEAAQRAAAIGYNLKIPATAFFSWPSRGKLIWYRADISAIEATEDEIGEFLVKFVRESGAKRVHVLAHSMGNYGLLRAMFRPVMRKAIQAGIRFDQIILAAPDVDTSMFRRDAAEYTRIARRVTLYASSADAALWLSKDIADFPRAGLAPPITVVRGIDTVDVGSVDFSMVGHSYAATAIPVLADMHSLVWQGTPPANRFGLQQSRTDDGMVYWVIK